MEIKLDDRLREIVNLIGKTDIVVDVGCDHGYVANYLVENNLSKMVYATDISYDSLMKNKDFSINRNNEDRVISVLGDGLIPLKDKDFDGVIIAGMGGELIIKIIEDAKSFLSNQTLVLQPMTSSRELRIYLTNNGYKILEESIVRDKNKYYEIIKAVPGISEESNCSFYFGNNLVENCDDTLLEYIDKLREKSINYMDRAKLSKTNKASQRVEQLQKEIELYEVILNGCKSKGNNRSS